MDYLNKIKSSFLQDRLKETSWRSRNYISDLYKLEKMIVSGGSNSWAGAMLFHGLKSEYPVEYECLKKELIFGEFTSPKKFKELRQELKLEKIKEHRATANDEYMKKEKQFKNWIAAGGR